MNSDDPDTLMRVAAFEHVRRIGETQNHLAALKRSQLLCYKALAAAPRGRKLQRFQRQGLLPDSVAHPSEVRKVRISHGKYARSINALIFRTVRAKSGALENTGAERPISACPGVCEVNSFSARSA